jgi:hypothetical protein
MIRPLHCYERFGEPTPDFERKHMVLWDVPTDINISIPTIPNKIYCNKQIVKPLEEAFRNLMNYGLHKELKTWDGCFNIRKMRGANNQSIHSWGLAIDVNAAWNGLGKEPTLSPAFVKCFTDAGFDWGGIWERKDGMHFQISAIQ